jgi:hypothetical protein
MSRSIISTSDNTEENEDYCVLSRCPSEHDMGTKFSINVRATSNREGQGQVRSCGIVAATANRSDGKTPSKGNLSSTEGMRESQVKLASFEQEWGELLSKMHQEMRQMQDEVSAFLKKWPGILQKEMEYEREMRELGEGMDKLTLLPVEAAKSGTDHPDFSSRPPDYQTHYSRYMSLSLPLHLVSVSHLIQHWNMNALKKVTLTTS